MASDMSGYQGDDGKRRWLEESGGTERDYNNEMRAWRQSQEAPADGGGDQPASGGAAPAGGGGGSSGGGGGHGGGSWNYDAGAARRAWQNAGSPNAPAGADFDAWLKEWFTAAVNAGSYTERGENTSQTAYESSGYNQGPDSTGLRARARANGWSEDFDRWSESQLIAWAKDLDPGCPPNDPFRGADGSCVQKPIDSNGSMMPNGQPNPNWNQGEPVDGGGGGGRGGRGGAAGPPPPPPKPTTFGNQLSLTGNPLQDMLIQQFNTGADPNTQQHNIFGLGEDMRGGGTGRNLDAFKSGRQAQSLGGGGLWWGQDANTFSGFDASVKNAEGAATPSPAAPVSPAGAAGGTGAQQPAAAATAAAPVQIGAPRQGGSHVAQRRNTGVTGGATMPGAPTPIVAGAGQNVIRQQNRTPMTGMLQSNFGSQNQSRPRPSYF